MNLPPSEPIDDVQDLRPARRRRQKRLILPSEPGERARFLQELAHRMSPTVDFFLFSLISGVVLGAAILFNSPALYVLAALVAPFLAPALGLSLAVMVGSGRYFFRSLAAFGVGGLLVFLCGAGAGWISQLTSPDISSSAFGQAPFHAFISVPDFLLVLLGSALAAILSVRSTTSKPLVPSAALAYELYLPLGVAGFGLVRDIAGLWPDGLLVFAVHLAAATLISLIALVFLGLQPRGIFGYSLGTTILLLGVVAAIALSGIGTALSTQIAMPPPSPSVPVSTLTRSITPTVTLTPRPPTHTATATKTLIPTATTTLTISPEPTMVEAIIKAKEGGGAYIHSEPGFSAPVITTLSNGWPVRVYGTVMEMEGLIWRKIRTADGVEGWIWDALLVTATPRPGW